MKNISIDNAVVIFQGAFDPPHKGHEKCLQISGQYFHSSIFLCIPSYATPNISGYEKKIGTPFKHRLEMCKVAFGEVGDNQNKMFVRNTEQEIEAPNYTIKTINFLKNEFTGNEFYLLTGLDTFDHLENWHDAASLIKECNFFVFERKTKSQLSPVELISNCLAKLGLEVKWDSAFEGIQKGDVMSLGIEISKIYFKTGESDKISSTNLRNNFDDHTSEISPKLKEYIKKHDLYTQRTKL